MMKILFPYSRSVSTVPSGANIHTNPGYTIYLFVVQSPLGSWQDKNWDAAVGSTKFDEFCEALGKPPFGANAADVNAPFGDSARMITLPGGLSLDFAILNYAKYIKDVSRAKFDVFRCHV
jgi:hypothetical protein